MSRTPVPVLSGVAAACLIASCLIAPAPLRAGEEGTLAQKKGWAVYQTGIDRTATQVDAKCGGRLRAGYDKASYPQFDPLRDRTQAACQAAVGTLAALCVNDAGKQSVRALAAARCRLSTDGTRVTRDGDTLIIHVDPARSSITGAQPGSYSWASALREIL